MYCWRFAGYWRRSPAFFRIVIRMWLVVVQCKTKSILREKSTFVPSAFAMIWFYVLSSALLSTEYVALVQRWRGCWGGTGLWRVWMLFDISREWLTSTPNCSCWTPIWWLQVGLVRFGSTRAHVDLLELHDSSSISQNGASWVWSSYYLPLFLRYGKISIWQNCQPQMLIF